MNNIRQINSNNIEECVSVIRESFMTVANQLGFTQENAPRFTAFAINSERLKWQLSEEHRPMYAYFVEDKIVGYYSFAMQDNNELELNNLCVLPEYRHKKIGDSMLRDAFCRAQELSCKKINIGIVEENTILREWYEQHGFVHTGTKKFDFFPFTCGYMEKSLLEQ